MVLASKNIQQLPQILLSDSGKNPERSSMVYTSMNIQELIRFLCKILVRILKDPPWFKHARIRIIILLSDSGKNPEKDLSWF